MRWPWVIVAAAILATLLVQPNLWVLRNQGDELQQPLGKSRPVYPDGPLGLPTQADDSATAESPALLRALDAAPTRSRTTQEQIQYYEGLAAATDESREAETATYLRKVCGMLGSYDRSSGPVQPTEAIRSPVLREADRRAVAAASRWPDNAFFPAIAAVTRTMLGDEPGARKFLAQAARASRYDWFPEWEVAAREEALRRRTGYRGEYNQLARFYETPLPHLAVMKGRVRSLVANSMEPGVRADAIRLGGLIARESAVAIEVFVAQSMVIGALSPVRSAGSKELTDAELRAILQRGLAENPELRDDIETAKIPLQDQIKFEDSFEILVQDLRLRLVGLIIGLAFLASLILSGVARFLRPPAETTPATFLLYLSPCPLYFLAGFLQPSDWQLGGSVLVLAGILGSLTKRGSFAKFLNYLPEVTLAAMVLVTLTQVETTLGLVTNFVSYGMIRAGLLVPILESVFVVTAVLSIPLWIVFLEIGPSAVASAGIGIAVAGTVGFLMRMHVKPGLVDWFTAALALAYFGVTLGSVRHNQVIRATLASVATEMPDIRRRAGFEPGPGLRLAPPPR